MVISLIGYRGCGKTTVAPLLAAVLGWSWIDSDQAIEHLAGCSIRQIFETEGEGGFRLREVQVLEQLLSQRDLVIAAGGGAILAESTRHRMQQAGLVIWLRADIGTLTQRIARDEQSANSRPSLTGQSVTDEIADVLAARTPLYHSLATTIIDVDQQTPEQIVETILREARVTLSRETRR